MKILKLHLSLIIAPLSGYFTNLMNEPKARLQGQANYLGHRNLKFLAAEIFKEKNYQPRNI